jgi:hypothetical protein
MNRTKTVDVGILHFYCIRNKQVYRNVCTVLPVKLATLVSRLPVIVGHIFMEPANSYDIIHGRYSITWPPAYLESWPQFSPLVLCFMYKCNLPMLANLKILYFLRHTVYRPNPHLLYKQKYHLPAQPPFFLHKCGQQFGISWWN